MDYFVDWLYHHNLPWSAYQEFMYDRLISMDKLPGEHPVGVREKWRQLLLSV